MKTRGIEGDSCDGGIQASLLRLAINPESRRYFDGKKILWEIWRFFDAHRPPLSDDKPPVIMQHNE